MPDILGRMWVQRRNEFHYDRIYHYLCVHRCVYLYLHLSFLSTALSSQRKMPITQTTGFKAGISVMAVALGLTIISVLAFFLLRRRQRNTLYGQPGPTTRVEVAKQSELDAEKPLAAPAYTSEVDAKAYLQPSELSA